MDEISLAGLNLAGPDKREEPDTVSEEPSEEEESLRMAQAMAISMGDVQGEADALFRLGEMYSWAWKLPVAEEHYAEARRKFHSIGKDIGELMALDGMMDAALFQRKFDAVRQYHADASQLYDRTGLPMSKSRYYVS
ncbi:hypothetical protein FRB90_001178 [Tulasnella sp. 427]|nr:hypothetical protein FRB90_001178 [Tulasnella sp. 427]